MSFVPRIILPLLFNLLPEPVDIILSGPGFVTVEANASQFCLVESAHRVFPFAVKADSSLGFHLNLLQILSGIRQRITKMVMRTRKRIIRTIHARLGRFQCQDCSCFFSTLRSPFYSRFCEINNFASEPFARPGRSYVCIRHSRLARTRWESSSSEDKSRS